MDTIDEGPLKGLPATPGRIVSAASMAAVARKDRAGWLAMCAEDCLVEDPVGPSPLSPDGSGHLGREAIGKFWDMTIGIIDVEFDIRESYAAGNECANHGSIHSTLPDGSTMRTDGVFVYRANDEGQLVSLKAYWEFEEAMKTLTPPAGSDGA